MEIPRTIRILICDDQPMSRNLLKDNLGALGFLNVNEFDNIEAAKGSLAKHHKTPKSFHLIISDWIMPNQSGIEFLHWVRSQPDFQDTPFILLTSQHTVDQVMEGISGGASSYIIKPIEKKTLMSKMEFAWKKHRRPPTYNSN